MKFNHFLISVALILMCLPTRAQVVLTGSADGDVKWSQVETPHFKIIYPRGLDSLSRVYGNALERAYLPVSHSTGFVPGQMYKAKTPVVLHSGYAYANASVMMAPRRMQFYTIPDAYTPTPELWEPATAMHEMRHLSQLQFPYAKYFKPFKWLSGDLVAASLSMIYPGLHLLEGDAVVAETAYSQGGRGRSGEFLNYYMSAFDQGDWRNWHAWRWGSYRHYAPDHYALGYMTVAGTRVFYDDPLFMKEYLQGVVDHPLRLFHMQKQIKKASGMKFKDAFSDIQHRFHDQWAADAAAKYIMKEEKMFPTDPWFLEYGAPVITDSGTYITRRGLREPCSLWYAPEGGKLKRVSAFAAVTSNIASDDKRMYWSEHTGDVRWPLRATSRIRYMDIGEKRFHTITTKSRFYNPVPDENRENAVLAVEYPIEGGCRIVRVSTLGKDRVSVVCNAPSGLQFADVVNIGDNVYASGVSEEGFGIYLVSDGTPKVVLKPAKASIRGLGVDYDGLIFASDRTGVPEIYEFDTKEGQLYQLSSTRYGAMEPSFKGDTLCYLTLTRDGYEAYKSTDYKRIPVEFSDVYKHYVADELTRQEKELGGFPIPEGETTFSEVKPYGKLAHLFRFHSWAPLYYKIDDLAEASFEGIYYNAAIGATVLFQNDLETAYGAAGYAFYPGGDNSHEKHGGYFQFTYTGLYPIITAEVNLNARNSYQYYRRLYQSSAMSLASVGVAYLDQPSISADITMYVPFKFSSGGWTRGITPTVKYSISNDRYSKQIPVLSIDAGMSGSSVPLFTGVQDGDNVYMQILEASVRGYTMRPTASSQTYPRLGIGAEIGYRARVSLTEFYSSAMYGYLYGYLPGIVRQQGLRLSALYQHLFTENGAVGENYAKLRPRGFETSSVDAFMASYCKDQMKFTADYSIPFYLGDISVFSPLLYIKNFELRPHFDYTMMSYGNSLGDGGLLSVGGEFRVHCGNFLWIPLDTQIGLTFSWNGGKSYGTLENMGYTMHRTYVGGVFSIDL